MATSNKKRGFRKIIVYNKVFTWNFPVDNSISIRPLHHKDNRLIIDFGWFDTWLHINDYPKKELNYDPQIVTPSFVRECILFALQSNWDIHAKTGFLKISYVNGQFQQIALNPDN